MTNELHDALTIATITSLTVATLTALGLWHANRTRNMADEIETALLLDILPLDGRAISFACACQESGMPPSTRLRRSLRPFVQRGQLCAAAYPMHEHDLLLARTLRPITTILDKEPLRALRAERRAAQTGGAEQ